MAKDLKVYNHLNYDEGPSQEKDEFIEFLYQHSDVEAPDVDEDIAWNSLNQKIHTSGWSFSWMKVAATVTILAILSVSVYLFNSTPSQIRVAALDKKVNVTFPDGSVGILNTNSSFTYPERFGDERRVAFSGEAYFDIQKSKKPFIIEMNGVDVRVLGTAFNLITTDKEVTLYVDRGLVAFEKEGIQTKVPAGKEAIFNKTDATVMLLDRPSANIMSWRNGIFNFDNTPLNKALAELSEYYQVEFKLSNDNLKQCRVSATFNEQPLSEVLKTLSSILKAKASIKGNIVKISGRGC